MLLHHIGQDTRIDFQWLESDEQIDPIEAAFTVVDADDQTVIDWTLTDDELTSDVYSIELHLPDDLSLSEGSYSYTLRARQDDEWTILSAGLLRVKS